MNNQYIPLVMLFSFSGILFGFGLLVLKGIQRQNHRDEINRRERGTHTV